MEPKQEHPEKHEHKEPAVSVISLAPWVPPQDASALISPFDLDGDGTLSSRELAEDGVKDEVYAVLKKLGLSDTAIESVLGVAPPEVRKAQRDERKAARDKRGNNGKGIAQRVAAAVKAAVK